MKLYLVSLGAGILVGIIVTACWFKEECVPRITGVAGAPASAEPVAPPVDKT